MARPSFQVKEQDQATVKTMSAHGYRHEDIAKVLKISQKTLRKHFRTELDLSAIEANSEVIDSLFKMASSGKNTAASVFWIKTRCGWRDMKREENLSLEGPPQVVIASDRP